MQGKTHIAIGVAVSLATLHPETATGIVADVAGGAIGGWLCDIDLKKKDINYDSGKLYNFILIAFVIGITAFFDRRIENGICDYVISHWGKFSIAGTAMFLCLCIIGLFSSHRTFTHSVLALILFSVSLGMVCFPLMPAFFIGYLSHIVIDLLNKKGEQIFFPAKRRVCFNWCASNGTVDTVLRLIGVLVSVVLIGWLFVVALQGENLGVRYNIQGLLPWLTTFQWYLVIVNTVTFIVMCIDHWTCMHTNLISDQNFVHTIENIGGLAGGGLGMLLAFAFLREPIGKHNANWYAIAISQTLCWGVIYFIICDPFGVGMNGVKSDVREHIPLLLYAVIINFITAIMFFRDRKTVRPKWKISEFIMFILGIFGGALGGFVAMIITRKKTNSPHFSIGFPILITSHVFIVSYLLVSGLA